MKKKRSNRDTIEKSVLAFLKKHLVRKDGEYIFNFVLHVEYLKSTRLDISEEEFYRIVDSNGFERGKAPPFDSMYRNVTWKDKRISARWK